MYFELGAAPKYEKERYNAYSSRSGIDTTLLIDERNIENYKSHLYDCKKNPTVGLLIRKKYITGKPMNYPETAYRNMRFMERQPKIDSLIKNVNNKIKNLYPRTAHIREYIIDKNRVVLDGTEKIKKYTIFNKLKIMLKRFV